LTVVSDGLACFKVAAADATGVHERHVTGGGKASVKLQQFNAFNTLLSNLKTAINGTSHAFNCAKHAHRYLGELQYRFNRRFDPSTTLRRLARAAIVTPPLPASALFAAEASR